MVFISLKVGQTSQKDFKQMEENNAVIPAAAPEDTTVVIDDTEARIAALEAEKARLIEEGANWKVAALKYKKEGKQENFEEDDEDRMRRIAAETLANSRLVEIAREQDDIIKRALKENKELKLAQLSKTGTPPVAQGTHSEGQAVQDTLVTADQMAAFKARGWTDKDIERYKKNLQKYGGR